MIIGLNMMDEAVRIGLLIDGMKLENILGVKVLPLIASRGQGIKNLFLAAMRTSRQNQFDVNEHPFSD